jgi:hypothetical protein
VNILAKCWFWVEYLIQEFWMLRTTRTNQDYMCVNYTLIVVYTMLLVTGSQSRNVSCFLPGYGPIAIADWSSILQCHLLVKHGFYRLLVQLLKWAYWVHWNDCLWSLNILHVVTRYVMKWPGPLCSLVVKEWIRHYLTPTFEIWLGQNLV